MPRRKADLRSIPNPPKGVILTSYDKIKAHQEKVKTSLETNYMPLGNLTKMTAEERQKVIQWIAQGAHLYKKTPDQVERLLAQRE